MEYIDFCNKFQWYPDISPKANSPKGRFDVSLESFLRFGQNFAIDKFNASSRVSHI